MCVYTDPATELLARSKWSWPEPTGLNIVDWGGDKKVVKAQLSGHQSSQIINISLWHFNSCQFFHLQSLRGQALRGSQEVAGTRFVME